MPKEKVIEITIGFIIILISIFFVRYVYLKQDVGDTKSDYLINAKFDNIDGIVEGSKIKISGIEIGKVTKITLEEDSFFAIVTMSIDKKIKIPEDSSAIISTNGIIGKKYIRITPGADESYIKNNEYIILTQSTINIEDIVSKILYSLTKPSNSKTTEL